MWVWQWVNCRVKVWGLTQLEITVANSNTDPTNLNHNLSNPILPVT